MWGGVKFLHIERWRQVSESSFWIQPEKFPNPTGQVSESNRKSFRIHPEKFPNTSFRIHPEKFPNTSFRIQPEKFPNPTGQVSESNRKSFRIQPEKFPNPPGKVSEYKFPNTTGKVSEDNGLVTKSQLPEYTSSRIQPGKFPNPTGKFPNPPGKVSESTGKSFRIQQWPPVKTHRKVWHTNRISDTPSDYSDFSPIAISLGSYMDKAAGRRACTGKKITQDVSVLSRWCLGDVSVMSRSCLGHVSVFFWVMSRCWCCLGLVSVMSRSCLGDVSVMSRSCLGGVSVMSLSFFGWCLGVGVVSVLSRWCLGDVSVMSRSCLGHVSVFFWVISRLCFVCVSWMIRWYLGDVSVILWWCVKMFSSCASDVLVIFKWCVGDVSVMCSDCVVMFWWYVGDALVLCWWCLCSVSVMLWCLSDGWWCCGDVFVMVLWCFGDEYWWTFSNFQWVPKQNEWLFDVSLILGSYAGLIFLPISSVIKEMDMFLAQIVYLSGSLLRFFTGVPRFQALLTAHCGSLIQDLRTKMLAKPEVLQGQELFTWRRHEWKLFAKIVLLQFRLMVFSGCCRWKYHKTKTTTTWLTCMDTLTVKRLEGFLPNFSLWRWSRCRTHRSACKAEAKVPFHCGVNWCSTTKSWFFKAVSLVEEWLKTDLKSFRFFDFFGVT